MQRIIANVSSYNRIDSLVKSIKSLYNQVDVINVALNDYYGEIPEILYWDKINLIFTDNSKGDSFKFLKLMESDGYFFTFDDDLIYPEGYVNYMISKCKEYDDKAIITLHGRNFNSIPIKSYYNSASEIYSYRNKVKNDVHVQYGGTGVMCFNTKLFKLGIDYFRFPNMADVWIGNFAKNNKIPIVCVKHDSNFVQTIPQEITIYNTESKNDMLQTIIVNGYDKTELSIIIPTYNNIDFIDKCIDSIEKVISNVNCEVLIGIDNCNQTVNFLKNKTFSNKIKFYFFIKNVGPYVVKNSLSTISNSDYLLFFDSDDIMNENMIQEIFQYKKTHKMIKPMYLDFINNEDKIRYEITKTNTYGEGVFAIDKEIFLSMNGFMAWRCAADSEFMNRLYKNNIKFAATKTVSFYRRIHSNSLTQHPDTGFNSKIRKNYINSSKLNSDSLKELTTEKFYQLFFNNNINLIDDEFVIKKQKITDLLNNSIKINPHKSTINDDIDYDRINRIINNKVYQPSQIQKQVRQNTPNNRNELNRIKKGGLVDTAKKMKIERPKPSNMIPNVFGGRGRN